MTLANANIQYVTIQDNIVTILQNALAVLNTGLTDVMVAADIKAGDPTYEPVPADKIPSVYVRFEGKPEEEFASLGASRKFAKIQYRIFGLTKRGTSAILADKEMTLLARNIEAVLRNNVALTLNSSNNCQYCNPSSLELSNGANDRGFYGMSGILLDCWLTIQ